jgi:hypothetical protein
MRFSENVATGANGGVFDDDLSFVVRPDIILIIHKEQVVTLMIYEYHIIKQVLSMYH